MIFTARFEISPNCDEHGEPLPEDRVITALQEVLEEAVTGDLYILIAEATEEDDDDIEVNVEVTLHDIKQEEE